MSTPVFTRPGTTDSRARNQRSRVVDRTPRQPHARPLGRSAARSVPHLAMGALLVVVCATGFAVAATRTDHRQPVLALARSVTVGQVLTGSDLRTVRVTADAGVAMIPAADSATVTGQLMALSLRGRC